MVDVNEILHGKWKKGLFELDPKLYLASWCCFPCTVAEIHTLKGDQWLGMNKCVACCVPIKPCQLWVYGDKMVPGEKPLTKVAKIWCCGICHGAQQYYEATAGSPKAMMELVTSIGKPSQAEMS